MADLIDARPSCPECGCLMVLDANTDYADDQHAYHWACRRACDRETPCDGRATTPRAAVLSGPLRTEDMAIKQQRGGPLTNNRMTRGHEAIRRALPELDQHNPLRTYLSTEENELVDVAMHVLGNLASSYERAEQTAANHDADWQRLADMASIKASDTAHRGRIADAFMDGSNRHRAIDRVHCLDDYVTRHHGKSAGLRALAHDYLGNPLESRWDALVDRVGRVLTTEAYNVRPLAFEQYWKGWRENLSYRRTLRRVKSLAFFDPDGVTAACFPGRLDPHQGSADGQG